MSKLHSGQTDLKTNESILSRSKNGFDNLNKNTYLYNMILRTPDDYASSPYIVIPVEDVLVVCSRVSIYHHAQGKPRDLIPYRYYYSPYPNIINGLDLGQAVGNAGPIKEYSVNNKYYHRHPWATRLIGRELEIAILGVTLEAFTLSDIGIAYLNGDSLNTEVLLDLSQRLSHDVLSYPDRPLDLPSYGDLSFDPKDNVVKASNKIYVGGLENSLYNFGSTDIYHTNIITNLSSATIIMDWRQKDGSIEYLTGGSYLTKASEYDNVVFINLPNVLNGVVIYDEPPTNPTLSVREMCQAIFSDVHKVDILYDALIKS